MLTSIKVLNRQGFTLDLPLGEATQGITLEEIEGLEPVKATLVSSSFANQDGEQYHSSRREARNIVIKLALEPDDELGTVRDIRKGLYDYFMPKSLVTLQFHTLEGDGVLDFLDLEIKARVESFESPLFVQVPEATISLMCFDPDFIDTDVKVLSGTTNTDPTNVATLVYPGTVETGIEFRMVIPTGTLNTFSIFHATDDGSPIEEMEFNGPMQGGDIITLSTIRGSKHVTLTRDGVDKSFLFALSPQSPWIEFRPGLNVYRVHGGSIPYTISYITRYGGL